MLRAFLKSAAASGIYAALFRTVALVNDQTLPLNLVERLQFSDRVSSRADPVEHRRSSCFFLASFLRRTVIRIFSMSF